MRWIRHFMASEDGPTAVEYAVLLALILMAIIGAIGAVGPKPAACGETLIATWRRPAWAPAKNFKSLRFSESQNSDFKNPGFGRGYFCRIQRSYHIRPTKVLAS